MDKFRDFIYHQHDIVCNQKYADKYPYSLHLSFVEAQGDKFMHLIPKDIYIENKQNHRSIAVSIRNIVKHALISHDVFEDGRLTYNDLLEVVNTEEFGNYKAAVMVADIVYCVTDEKGKSRKERKNEKYYREIKENHLAIFVKLADLSANILFSKLTNSSMFDKYKQEWPNFKEKLYVPEYKEFFDYIDNILSW